MLWNNEEMIFTGISEFLISSNLSEKCLSKLNPQMRKSEGKKAKKKKHTQAH